LLSALSAAISQTVRIPPLSRTLWLTTSGT
jgi:hypothetical protein